MEKNADYGGYSPYDNLNYDFNDPMFNPMMQYEQAYMYYRYLCMQLDYKIKCKEYERLTSKDGRRVEWKHRICLINCFFIAIIVIYLKY